jgi:hypothetical protein
MNRLEATRLLVAAIGAEPIIASLGHPAYDLFAAGDRPANFYTWGSMGLASSVGLGLALARPDLRVFVVDGDGSLLMNLGSLATIGWTRPANLVLIVWDNQSYGTTGGQDTATAHGADLEGAARAMGAAATVTGDCRRLRRRDRAVARRTGAVGDRREGRGLGANRQATARLRVHQTAVHGGDRRAGRGDARRTSVRRAAARIDQRSPSGITGSRRCEGYCAVWWTTFRATAQRVSS